MARHGVDILSFVSGALVLGVGLLLLSGGLGGMPLEWVGPVVAIGLGVVIVIAARPARSPAEPESPGEPEPRILP